MADPITPALILVNTALAILGNRADAAAVGGARKLAERLRKGGTPVNHDVLAASHRAFVQSIQLMAATCDKSGGDEKSYFVSRRLSEVANGPGLTTLKVGAPAIPKKEFDANIRALYEGADSDPARNATEMVIAALEGAMGEPLTDGFRTLFRDGSDRHPSWAQAFELFFAEQVKTNERVSRALTFERLNELLALAEARARDVAVLQDSLAQGFTESAERGARMEGKLDALLEAVLADRGGQIETAGIDPEAIVKIARKVSENVSDPHQALAEIDSAIDNLLALRQEAARGSNLDTLVEQALRRIDARAAAGQFDEAAREASKAFAEWDQREAERRDRGRAIGIRFAEENIRTNRLRRDADAVAEWMLRKAALEQGDARAADIYLKALVDSGRDKGVNFDLDIAASLALGLRRLWTDDHWAARTLVWRGIALSTLGMRREGSDTLEASIAAYREALAAFSLETTAHDWAMTQNNLGNALKELGSRQEGTGELEEAATAFRAALKVYTKDNLPLDWAMTQNNLGAALSLRGERREGTESLKEAVAIFRAVLQVYSRDRTPLDWAMTQNNLGNALGRLGQRGEGIETLNEAIAAYREVLQVYTPDDRPLDWAMAQNNLGTVLASRGLRYNEPGSFQEAVAAIRAALRVYARETMPVDWARTQLNLGNVLAMMARRLGDCDTASQAVTAVEGALEVLAHPQLEPDRANGQRILVRVRALRDRLCCTAKGEPPTSA